MINFQLGKGYLVAICIIYCMAMGGCCTDQPAPEEKKIVPFTLSIARGGGVTGLVEGCNLFSDGKIEFWEEFPGQEKKVIKSGKTDIAQIQAFQKALLLTGAIDKEIKGTGNMTTYASYFIEDKDYNWSWDSDGSTDDETLKSLVQWYSEVELFCQKEKEKQ